MPTVRLEPKSTAQISFSDQCFKLLSTIILCINSPNLYFHLFFAGEIIPNDLSSLESNENFDMDDSFHLEVLQVGVPPSASRQPCTKARRQLWQKTIQISVTLL